MTSVKPHGPLTVETISVRRTRKPAFTYRSPAQSTAILHSEKPVSASESTTTSVSPDSSPSDVSRMSEPSQRGSVTRLSTRLPMTAPPLPLYHPFGNLALSLPDLDPIAFGLPAPVAVFDDPTRRSHRQRRPAAKVREAGDTTAQPPPVVAATPAPETEAREKASPRRRRGGGPGGRRRRREPEDGDATYPAKRPRHPRSSGASGLSGTRTLSREEGSPALSNARSRASSALDTGQGDVVEEKKVERRSTRSRGTVSRRDSTASEETTTSTTPSVSVTNAAPPRVASASSGEQQDTDEGGAKDASKEAVPLGVESEQAEPDKTPVPEQQEK